LDWTYPEAMDWIYLDARKPLLWEMPTAQYYPLLAAFLIFWL
jgi:hypothetical protein